MVSSEDSLGLGMVRTGLSACSVRLTVDLSTTNLYPSYTMEQPLTYRGSFVSEENAKEFVATLIKGGVIQQVGNIWYTWQIN